ncbi:alpha/beta hydrolase [Jiangella sp. DSM 45060]|uniref:alpha/beta hydrolase n=1 Tax=Jiangella sp. DSM 45060 TaxID=1798224 RepID=UPI00087922E2|nr:alpha/beta hydrolase [Jiangella sp. DSM 45060]SDT41356.1 Lysophospholipase, alpha-beta hydrolase superfamily [Jiangella sp. DSM 45060]
MSVVETAPGVVAFDPPGGVTARGTVVVLPGRGEHGGVYERFGQRLAADGYVVRALGEGPATASAAGVAVAAVLAVAGLPRPYVLAGSDTGAVLALAVAGPLGADAVVVAGYPVAGGSATAGGSAETGIEARTACPVHAGRLRDDPRFVAAALAGPVPDGGPLDAVEVPVLALHGAADTVSPYRAARAALSAVPGLVLVTLAGGRHDAFNDRSHRTAAAHVVLFLEDLRAGSAVAASERLD